MNIYENIYIYFPNLHSASKALGVFIKLHLLEVVGKFVGILVGDCKFE